MPASRSKAPAGPLGLNPSEPPLRGREGGQGDVGTEGARLVPAEAQFEVGVGGGVVDLDGDVELRAAGRGVVGVQGELRPDLAPRGRRVAVAREGRAEGQGPGDAVDRQEELALLVGPRVELDLLGEQDERLVGLVGEHAVQGAVLDGDQARDAIGGQHQVHRARGARAAPAAWSADAQAVLAVVLRASRLEADLVHLHIFRRARRCSRGTSARGRRRCRDRRRAVGRGSAPWNASSGSPGLGTAPGNVTFRV